MKFVEELFSEVLWNNYLCTIPPDYLAPLRLSDSKKLELPLHLLGLGVLAKISGFRPITNRLENITIIWVMFCSFCNLDYIVIFHIYVLIDEPQRLVADCWNLTVKIRSLLLILWVPRKSIRQVVCLSTDVLNFEIVWAQFFDHLGDSGIFYVDQIHGNIVAHIFTVNKHMDFF